MRNISRGLDCPRCPFQVGLPIGRFYNRDRPVISQLRATHTGGSKQFCGFILQLTSAILSWGLAGKWAQSAQLYISRGCLSLSCILHRAGILQTPSRTCILWCQPQTYKTKYYDASVMMQILYNMVPTSNIQNKTLWCQCYDANTVYYGANLQLQTHRTKHYMVPML